MKTPFKTIKSKLSKKDIEIIDLTNKNLFEAIQIIIDTSSAPICKSPQQKVKYKSNIPNIEQTIKDIPILSAVEFV